MLTKYLFVFMDTFLVNYVNKINLADRYTPVDFFVRHERKGVE